MIKVKKLVNFIVLCLIFVILLFQTTFAGAINVSSVNRLNLSRGTVSGATVAYTLNIRNNWQTYLIAERETFDYPIDGLLEKITFFYVTQLDRATKPIELMTFYVYDSAYWSNRTIIRKILETENHVFAASAAPLNPFSAGDDRTVFAALLREASSDVFIKNMIKLPAGTKILTHNVAWVANREMLSPSVKIGSIVYIPVRDVCNALGYQVTWIAKPKSIRLQKGTRFDYIMKVVGQSNRQSLDAILINNKAYASSMFFTQILKVSVEIDDNNNVYIIE